MVSRKHPIKHHVKSHIRSGYRVNDYVRGHGFPHKVVVTRRPWTPLVSHNPGIQLKDLRDPWSGAPLEPAPEYGSSIMYSPYTGTFVMVSVPEARIAAAGNPSATYVVKPRFTQVDEGSLKIAKNYLTQSAREIEKDKSFNALERAYRHLDDAQRVEPWHQYPQAGLEKNPVYVQLKETSTLVGNFVDSARESDNPVERQKWVEKARSRILSAKEAIAGN